MEQPDLYTISGRCLLNAHTFSKLLVTYDMNANNLKVTIKPTKETSFFYIQENERKEVNQSPFSKDITVIDHGNKSDKSSLG